MTVENVQQADKKKLLQEIVSLEQRINSIDPEESGAAHRQYEDMQGELKNMIQVALNWNMHKEQEKLHPAADISITVGNYMDTLAQRYKLKKEGDPNGQSSAL